MLATMRKLSKTWVFKGLMVLLVVSFGIWGIGDMFHRNPSQREVARVGKETIVVQTLQNEFQRNLQEMRKQYGSELTAEQAKKLGLLEQSLQQMVDRSALDQESEKQGLLVSDALVLKRLGAMAQFRDKDGKFNTPLFQQALNSAGLTEKSFFDLERKEMARQILLNSLAGMKPPKTMIDDLYEARGAKRILEVVSIRGDAMRDVKAPSEDEMKVYYEANKDSFIAPEMRGYTIASLSVPALEKDVKVTPEALQKAYESQKEALTVPETRDLVQIVVQEQDKADSIAQKAQKTGDLSKAAKEAGLTPIVMNKIDEKTVLPELYASLFGMQEGAVSGVLKSSLGYHVAQIKKVHPAGTPSFDAVKDELRETLRQDALSERVAQILKEWDDAVASGTPLEDIADTLKLRLTRVAASDIHGVDPNGKALKDIPMAETLIGTAFDQTQGEVGQIIDDGKDNYYVVRTDVVTPSQARAFDEVKKQVERNLVAERQAAQTARVGTEIAQAMREGQKATSFASRPGVSVRLSKPISLLGEVDRSLSAEILEKAYQLKKGEVMDAPSGEVHLVLRMADIVPVDPKRPEASRLRVVTDLEKAVPYDLVGLFSAYTKQAHPVSIDIKLLETLKAQGEDVR